MNLIATFLITKNTTTHKQVKDLLITNTMFNIILIFG